MLIQEALEKSEIVSRPGLDTGDYIIFRYSSQKWELKKGGEYYMGPTSLAYTDWEPYTEPETTTTQDGTYTFVRHEPISNWRCCEKDPPDCSTDVVVKNKKGEQWEKFWYGNTEESWMAGAISIGQLAGCEWHEIPK